jgi:GT2 family glycosyltransferase
MISVIIPTRDRGRDLARCLGGLERQDAPELLTEVIVVDDHSAVPVDGAAFAGHALPVVVARNGGRPGPAAARNIGARAATGDVLAFLDDDAVPAGDWLRRLHAHFEERRCRALTGRILGDEQDCVLARARQLRYDRRHAVAERAERSVHFLAGGNAAVSAAAFRALGGMDETFEMMHDQEFALRLTASGVRCTYASDVIIRHRHCKGWRSAFGTTLRSARYRVMLGMMYGHRARWSVRSYVTSVRGLVARGVESGDYAAAVVAVLLETLHGAAVLWSRVWHVGGGPASARDGMATRHSPSAAERHPDGEAPNHRRWSPSARHAHRPP